jgi:hypothetical protein
MASKFLNKLSFLAFSSGEVLNAGEALAKMRRFLLGLEPASPWHRPFSVSGTTEAHSYMPISADLSDFVTVAMTALSDWDDVKFRNPDPNNFDLTIDAFSPGGLTTEAQQRLSDIRH